MNAVRLCVSERVSEKLCSDDVGGDGQIYRRAEPKEEKREAHKIEGPSERIPRNQKEISRAFFQNT